MNQAKAAGAGIEDLIVFFQTGLRVVGIQDRIAGGVGEAFGAEHFDIGIADEQDAGGAERSGRYRMFGLVFPDLSIGRRAQHVFGVADMSGEIGFQLLGHADRTHSGAATAMGNGKGLVQIEVTYVRPDETRTGQTNLRVHSWRHPYKPDRHSRE